jgi:hypothetical protein
MANPITKVKVGDQELPARELEFETVNEPWSEYKLSGGGRVKSRSTLLRVYRVVDDNGKPAYQPDGQPYLIVTLAPQLIASE